MQTAKPSLFERLLDARTSPKAGAQYREHPEYFGTEQLSRRSHGFLSPLPLSKSALFSETFRRVREKIPAQGSPGKTELSLMFAIAEQTSQKGACPVTGVWQCSDDSAEGRLGQEALSSLPPAPFLAQGRGWSGAYVRGTARRIGDGLGAPSVKDSTSCAQLSASSTTDLVRCFAKSLWEGSFQA